MNLFNNFMGGKGRGNDCCCTIIWLLFLLSICGNGFGGDGCECILILILLLVCSCDKGFGDMGCRG